MRPVLSPASLAVLALGALVLGGCKNPPATPVVGVPEPARAESPPTAPAPLDTVRRQAEAAETTRVPGASEAPLRGQVTLSADPFTVVPGERVGRVHLGMALPDLVRDLGVPDRTDADAALGRTWTTWTADGPGTAQLDVYTVRTETGTEAVRLVRVTAPDFQTQSGVGPGATRERVLSFFRDARAATSSRGTPFLVDERRGVAFECDGTAPADVCPVLLVHAVGDDPVKTYLPPPPIR